MVAVDGCIFRCWRFPIITNRLVVSSFTMAEIFCILAIGRTMANSKAVKTAIGFTENVLSAIWIDYFHTRHWIMRFSTERTTHGKSLTIICHEWSSRRSISLDVAWWIKATVFPWIIPSLVFLASTSFLITGRSSSISHTFFELFLATLDYIIWQLGRKYCYDDVLRAIFAQKNLWVPMGDSNPQPSDRRDDALGIELLGLRWLNIGCN